MTGRPVWQKGNVPNPQVVTDKVHSPEIAPLLPLQDGEILKVTEAFYKFTDAALEYPGNSLENYPLNKAEARI